MIFSIHTRLFSDIHRGTIEKNKITSITSSWKLSGRFKNIFSLYFVCFYFFPFIIGSQSQLRQQPHTFQLFIANIASRQVLTPKYNETQWSTVCCCRLKNYDPLCRQLAATLSIHFNRVNNLLLWLVGIGYTFHFRRTQIYELDHMCDVMINTHSIFWPVARVWDESSSPDLVGCSGRLVSLSHRSGLFAAVRQTWIEFYFQTEIKPPPSLIHDMSRNWDFMWVFL